MKRRIKNTDARKAERFANHLVALNLVQFDEEANGGRIVVSGRKAVYICTDCYAIGNVSLFDSAEQAIRWAKKTIKFFANAE